MQQKQNVILKKKDEPQSSQNYYKLLCFIHSGEPFPLGTIRPDRTLNKHGPWPLRQSPNACTRQSIHIYEKPHREAEH